MRNKNPGLLLGWIFVGALVIAGQVCAIAADPDPNGPSKQILFDDAVVEGMNQNSKDSLETIGKKDAAGRNHLYKKRKDFKENIALTGREFGDLP